VSAAAAIAALPLSSLILWALLRVPSVGARLVALPSRERWHRLPTPTFGGVGITVGLLAGIGLATLAGAVEPTWQLGAIVLGCGMLFLAGLVDDIRHLSPVAKLAAQFVAAGLAAAAGLRLDLIQNDVVAGVIAVIWLVGITNAFNLLDNMDGLAATLAAVACGYFAIDAARSDDGSLVLVLALALGAACCGFLPFNLRPGRRAAVFMGDSGSQVLGFLLATLALASSWTAAGATLTTMVLPLLVLAVPILDTTLVTVVRMLERRPVTQGGKDHTSHRLVYYGLSESRAVAFLAVVSVVIGATALAYNVLDDPQITAIGVLLTFVLLVQFGNFLSDLNERTRRGQSADVSWLHALAFEPRRLLEVIGDFVIVCGAFGLSYLLLVGGRGTDAQVATGLAALPVVLGARYVTFVAFSIYRRVWRFATARDALSLVVACAISEAVAFGIFVATRDLGPLSVRIFLVDALICAAVVCAARLSWRLFPELGAARNRSRRRLLIVGAGQAGRSLARELRETGEAKVVGFVDDNLSVRRRRIHGVRVLGTIDELEAILGAARADEVLVSIPNAEPSRLDEVERATEAAGIPCRVVRRRTEAIGSVARVTAE
jgi:UDP-GlcNAc:undecaprenyl-phosphate GlcNAc-1-phosphate transferase